MSYCEQATECSARFPVSRASSLVSKTASSYYLNYNALCQTPEGLRDRKVAGSIPDEITQFLIGLILPAVL
jgi:hypothetical protein